jgi:hypothetical protein
VLTKRQRLLEDSGDLRPKVYYKSEWEDLDLNEDSEEKKIPLALLHEIFEQFAENMQTYQPSATDEALVRDLRHVMPAEYETDEALCQEFRRALGTHYTEIQFEAAEIGSTKFKSDGHTGVGDFIFSMIEGTRGWQSRFSSFENMALTDAPVRPAKLKISLHKDDLYEFFPCIIIYFVGEIMDPIFYCTIANNLLRF